MWIVIAEKVIEAELEISNYEISRNSPIILKFDTLLGNSQLKNKLWEN